MADQKISELNAATSAAGADLLTIVQGGSNKKLTVQNFLANLNSPVIVNENGADQDTRVEGSTDENLIFVDASADKVGISTNAPQEKLDVDGNLAISGGFLRLSQTPQSASGTATGSLTTSVTSFTLTTGGDSLSLANGVAGQVKHVVVIGGVGSCTVTPTTRLGFSSVTMNGAGDTLTLMYVDDTSGWALMAQHGCTVNI
jgi:hypothetical protein